MAERGEEKGSICMDTICSESSPEGIDNHGMDESTDDYNHDSRQIQEWPKQMQLPPGTSSASPPPKFLINDEEMSSIEFKNLAVETDNLCFGYKKGVNILKNVSLNIPEGTIYGLLGPSGCGKTSLLRCLLNQLIPTSGDIRIFGKTPGSKGSNVPGHGVGFMPQEIALYLEFSIQEIITYFGRLHRLKEKDIQQRVSFLLEFLNLPEKDRLLRELRLV